jgi:hypothetical protein
MATPLKNIRSLETIENTFTVFERDQVLTEAQLNSMRRYLDDQTRLTRVELAGVGIVGGLKVSATASQVRVTPGVGVTTDGDLLMLETAAVFDAFKPYDSTAPVYAPFYDGTTMKTLFELVRLTDGDPTALPLSALPGALTDRVVVMLMESCESDPDLCSGTDCDNLGKDATNTTRLLLAARNDASGLAGALSTHRSAAAKLDEIGVARPQLAASVTDTSKLAQLYREACKQAEKDLGSGWKLLAKALPRLIADAFGADPAAGWIARLDAVSDEFATRDVGIQYYYEFLGDLATTWNELREALFDDESVLQPSMAAFPKHVLLGDLDDPTQSRTGFYPSPLVSPSRQGYARARFLLLRTHALVNSFSLPRSSTDAIRVTPSRTEASPLDARAIPYYYETKGAAPVQLAWNERLTARGESGRNLGYRAAEYRGTRAEPLKVQIGSYDCFRVEGHVGRKVDDAVQLLNDAIRKNNLPFAVKSVLLHTDRRRIIVKPPIRYTPLHTLHYLFRTNVAAELADSRRFTEAFKADIDATAAAGDIPAKIGDKPVPIASQERAAQVTTAATNAIGKLATPKYTTYRAVSAGTGGWQVDHKVATEGAGAFKQTFGAVVRTDFSTPFDSLVTSNHYQWLGWLDTLIDAKDARDDEKLLFGSYITQNPGLEHHGGVTPGGTLVLIYDDGGQVVADGMLPYAVIEEDDAEPDEPSLIPPMIRPDLSFNKGFVLQYPLRTLIEEKVNPVANGLLDLQKNVNIQADYFDFFTTSLDRVATIGGGRKNSDLIAGGLDLNDLQLGYYTDRVDNLTKQVDAGRKALLQQDLPDTAREGITKQLKNDEIALAGAIADTTEHMAQSKTPVTAGSDGGKVVTFLSSSMDKVSNNDALKALGTGLNRASERADAAQRNAIRNLLAGKGL